MPRLIKIAFWSAAAFAFVMAVFPPPPELPVSDKIQHIAAFVVITVLGSLAYPKVPRTKLMLALIAFGGLIEVTQLVPDLHRDSQWSDWLADIAAVIGAFVCVRLVERLRAALTR